MHTKELSVTGRPFSMYLRDDLCSNTNKNDGHMGKSYEDILRFSISEYHILGICLPLISKMMPLMTLR